jgi:hypothetical protein
MPRAIGKVETAGSAKRYAPDGNGVWHANQAIRRAERDLAHQAEVALRPHRSIGSGREARQLATPRR